VLARYLGGDKVLRVILTSREHVCIMGSCLVLVPWFRESQLWVPKKEQRLGGTANAELDFTLNGDNPDIRLCVADRYTRI
jgi:hypothetical protein